ncbi:DUF2897 family protein [Psychromonas sp. MME2]|uniref:DUF2897 family protein n=1 Tax=unclassified Psychromonas TaxID=2614957 RepID=UPI00339CD799
MSTWSLLLLIMLILGVIVGNLMLLKHSANMKLPDNVIKSIKEREKKKRMDESDKSDKSD